MKYVETEAYEQGIRGESRPAPPLNNYKSDCKFKP